jgi:hypothetical protein
MSGNLNDLNDSIYRLSRAVQVGLGLIFVRMMPIDFSRFGSSGALIEIAYNILLIGFWVWAMTLLHRVTLRSQQYRRATSGLYGTKSG